MSYSVELRTGERLTDCLPNRSLLTPPPSPSEQRGPWSSHEPVRAYDYSVSVFLNYLWELRKSV